jgi:hypothetical protein
MYVLSRHGGSGRGIWRHIEDGTITIKDTAGSFKVVVHAGQVLEQVHRIGAKCTTVRFGLDLIVTQSGKTVEQVLYEPGTVQAIRKSCLWRKRTDLKLCKTPGVLECYSNHSGSYAREVFTYSNGVVAYTAIKGAKRLEIRRPNGKLWIVVEGRIRLRSHSIAERLDLNVEDLGLWRLMDWNDTSLTVYGPSGIHPVTKGHFDNHQRQGRWLQRGKVEYYLSGVQVKRSLFEQNPDQWDPLEVLKIPNTQIRSSFLNKMGYEKLLERLPHHLIDSDTSDGSQLLSLETAADNEILLTRDRVMRLLKVICPSTGATYVLRVPPTVESCQQARHWTFGLELDEVRNGSRLQLLTET